MSLNCAFAFERYAVGKEQHHEAPQRARDVYNADTQGMSALVKHPIHGWAVIGGGQGPYFVWRDTEIIRCVREHLRYEIREGRSDGVVRALLNSLCLLCRLSEAIKPLGFPRKGERNYNKFTELCELFDRTSETAHEMIIALDEEGI